MHCLCQASNLVSIPSVDPTSPVIGTLNEGSLHRALKERYARPGDRFEVPLADFVIDIVRPPTSVGPELLIEIQTGSFAAMGRKLDHLLESHRMLLVHPIAAVTHLERGGQRGRRSPLKGTIYDLFAELVSIPTLLDHPNLEIDVVLVAVHKLQVEDPRARRGRGGFRTVDRTLQSVLSEQRIRNRTDLASLLPDGLPEPFTTADLARGAGISRDAAQKMAYCLRSLDLLAVESRSRDGFRYRRGVRPAVRRS